ncbi:MAG: LapA family protein [Cyanobacteria bacterium P01_A01_bin.135]
MALVIGLLLLAVLAAFTVQNWAPAVPLVVFGTQTAALPLALWVIGAMLAGALTVLLMAVLLRLVAAPPSQGGGTRYRNQERARQRYVADDDLGDFDAAPDDARSQAYNPVDGGTGNPYVDRVDEDPRVDYDKVETGFGDNGPVNPSSGNRANFTQLTSRADDWDSFSRPRQDWTDWGRSPAASARRDAEPVRDVNPVEVSRAEDEEDWRWSGYDEPRSGPRPRYSEDDDNDYPDDDPYEGEPVTYRQSAPYEASYPDSYTNAGHDIPDYGDRPPDQFPDQDAPEYDPGYAPEPDDRAGDTFSDNGPAADQTYEDYIIDYGSEAEIDQFDPTATRRSGQGGGKASQDPAPPPEEAWDDWESPPEASPAPEPPRDIYEVPAAPREVSRSGSVYSYRYRDEGDTSDQGDRPEEVPPPPDTSNVDASTPAADGDDSNSDTDTPRRTLIPPPPADDPLAP